MTVPAVQTLTEVVESKIMADKKPVNFSLAAWCSASWRKIVSEFLATAMLLLFGCMSCVPFQGYQLSIFSSIGFGMAVMFNIQIFGHISGAHMNPAVTLSYVLFGGCGVLLGIAYAIAQCLGAIAGYGLLFALVSTDLIETGVCVTQPIPSQTTFQNIGFEAALTSAIILINCAMWDPVNKDKTEAAPIKFGLAIVGLALVGGPFTGASFNPARSLGPAVWTNIWANQWIYWVGPLAGSVVSTYFYKIVFLVKSAELASSSENKTTD